MFLRIPKAMGVFALAFCFATFGTVCFPSARAGKPSAGKLKVYISVDMEGVAGTVTADQLLPSGFEYERFRRFMTDEALAAVRAATHAGATEIVVSDSHGNGDRTVSHGRQNCAFLAASRKHDGR
jgi:D-aminopeptidase